MTTTIYTSSPTMMCLTQGITTSSDLSLAQEQELQQTGQKMESQQQQQQGEDIFTQVSSYRQSHPRLLSQRKFSDSIVASRSVATAAAAAAAVYNRSNSTNSYALEMSNNNGSKQRKILIKAR